MPQITTITVNDREATPVAHVFTSDKRDNNGTVVAVRNTGVLSANEILSISARNGGKYRNVRFTLMVPIVQTETLNGISRPLEVRRGYAEVKFSFDRNSSLKERENLVGLTYNALAASQVDLNKVFTIGESPF